MGPIFFWGGVNANNFNVILLYGIIGLNAAWRSLVFYIKSIIYRINDFLG